MGSRVRATRSGGSLRMHNRIAVDAVIGSSRADAACNRRDRRDRIARQSHDQKPDGRVPKADHDTREA